MVCQNERFQPPFLSKIFMEVSTEEVLRARRTAKKLRTWTPCSSCKVHGAKCNQFRPCSRCLKLARPCFKSGQATNIGLNIIHTAVIPAQRPLNFQPRFAIGDESLSAVALAPGMLWASIELMKHQALGHKMDSLSQFFASLTVHDCSALSVAMHGAEKLGRSTVLQPAANSPNTIQDAAVCNAEGCERSEYWERETGTASFSTTFDPTSSRRRDIIANARHASVYGVHPEEFQARCASRELPFPFAEADAVALTIYGAVCEQLKDQAPPERFLRLYVGGGVVAPL
jgi:hypothetical protein